MLAGVERTWRVLLGDTLLKQFQPEEIEVIFAHEIGHHVFHHIRKLVVLGLLSSAAGFWICDRLLTGWVHWHGGAIDYADLPVATLPLLLWLLAILDFLRNRGRIAASRHFERQSDRYACGGPGWWKLIARPSKNWPGRTKATPTRIGSQCCCSTAIRRSRSGWRWQRNRPVVILSIAKNLWRAERQESWPPIRPPLSARGRGWGE